MNKYDEWNEIKKKTSKNNIKIGIKPRDIFWVKIGHNIGSEEYGKGQNFTRPVIIIRKLTSELFIGIPTTSKLRNNDYFHQFQYHSKKDGDIEVSAMILQLKVFSIKRITNRIGMINKNDFNKIIKKSQKLFAPT